MAETQKERRFTIRLLNYWEKIRGNRPFPSENDIDPEEISDMWDNCFLLQVRDIQHIQDYNYTYLGSEIVKAYQAGISNDACTVIISPNANKLQPSFDAIMTTKTPLVQDGEFTNMRQQVIKYRQILLPLGENAEDVNAIFGGMRFKLYNKQ